MKNKEAISEFYLGLQTQLQIAIMEIVFKNSEAASKVDASVGGVAQSLGSSTASVFYELIRDETQKSGFTGEQKKHISAFLETFILAYNEKVALIEDPLEFSKIATSTTSH